MTDQCIASRSRSDPPPVSLQELRAKRSLHSGNAFAHGSKSKIHYLRALGEAALLNHGQEQSHIRQIEAQVVFLRICRTLPSEMTNCGVWFGHLLCNKQTPYSPNFD